MTARDDLPQYTADQLEQGVHNALEAHDMLAAADILEYRMTARDDLTALIGTPTRGLCPRSCRDTRDGPHVHNTLDAIASLATNPATAPVVFTWLVEVGVLEEGVGWLCPTSGLLLESPCSHDPVLLYAPAREFGEGT